MKNAINKAAVGVAVAALFCKLREHTSISLLIVNSLQPLGETRMSFSVMELYGDFTV